MNEPIMSPLIKGKPAWHVRFMRFVYLYMAGNSMVLIGQILLIQKYGFVSTQTTIYSMSMLLWVFGYQVWLARWA